MGRNERTVLRPPSICHPDKPQFGNGMCRRCYDLANRTTINASKQSWKAANKEKAAAALFRGQLKKYGITPEQFYVLVEYQGGVCAGCLRTCRVFGRLSIDHCHTSKNIRGLLCSACNMAVGGLEDNPDTLLRLVDYLERARNRR